MAALPVVLTFGLSDATGAAGVQADQLACASMGCHPATVITAIAASARGEDDEWVATDAELVDAQAKSVLQNMAVAAFKIGALASVDQVQPVAEAIADFSDVPVVLDPVDHSTGEDWTDEQLMEAIQELLLPQTTVITLSLAQARRFASHSEADDGPDLLSPAECARHLCESGAEYVLILDAEPASTQMVNLLFDESGLRRREAMPRVDDLSGSRFRGVGDTLSAGLAGLLAQGIDVPEAVQEASQYTTAALMHAFAAAIGVAVPDRLFWAGDDDEEEASTSAN